MLPKVTVVTTLYNYSNYIGYTIRSFLDQDFQDSEMVIVNDGSKDSWKEVVMPFVRSSGGRVRIIDLQKNYGYSTAKNAGIYCAKAPVLVMLDADDLLRDHGITHRYATMEGGKFDMVHAPALKLGKNNAISDDFYTPQQRAKAFRKSDGYRLIHAQGVMIRKKAHDIVGMYDESMKCSSDKEMWARCLKRLKIGFSEHPCALYRIHDGQMHKSKWKKKNLESINNSTKLKIQSRQFSLSDVTMLSNYMPPATMTELT
jgi:glycosyltransferase involved in cell wall biosynthesis